MAEPTVVASPWTPAMISALFVGLAAIISALGKVLVELRESKKAVANITTLVDGTRSVLLRKIAYLLRNTANASSRESDRKMAEEAEREADEQEARVAAAAKSGGQS